MVLYAGDGNVSVAEIACKHADMCYAFHVTRLVEDDVAQCASAWTSDESYGVLAADAEVEDGVSLAVDVAGEGRSQGSDGTELTVELLHVYVVDEHGLDVGHVPFVVHLAEDAEVQRGA